jgi:hypothetical protein
VPLIVLLIWVDPSRETVEVGVDGLYVICSPMLALECCQAIGVRTGKLVHIHAEIRQSRPLLNLQSCYRACANTDIWTIRVDLHTGRDFHLARENFMRPSNKCQQHFLPLITKKPGNWSPQPFHSLCCHVLRRVSVSNLNPCECKYIGFQF